MGRLQPLVACFAAAIIISGCSNAYTEKLVRDQVHEELRSQFIKYYTKPQRGAIIVRPDPGKECIDRFDQCVTFYVRPLDEGDQLFRVKSENLRFSLERAVPDEPQLSGITFFYRWTCCGSEAIARGTAAFSSGKEIILEGQTSNGEELEFSY
jgi:hypothetical protein